MFHKSRSSLLSLLPQLTSGRRSFIGPHWDLGLPSEHPHSSEVSGRGTERPGPVGRAWPGCCLCRTRRHGCQGNMRGSGERDMKGTAAEIQSSYLQFCRQHTHYHSSFPSIFLFTIIMRWGANTIANNNQFLHNPFWFSFLYRILDTFR